MSACELESKTNKNDIALSTQEPTRIVKPKIVEVCACNSLNNTGVEVRNGEKYIFQVEKITEPWLDGVIRANPHDGWIDAKWFGFMIWFLKRSNEAPWYGLVGTFDKASTQSFAPLEYYDEKNAFTIDIHDKDKAELYLYANDKEGRYFNNQGKLKLKITLLKNSPNKKDQH